MAHLLSIARKEVSKATGFVASHSSAYYKQLLERNQQYVVGDASRETVNELSKKLLYTSLASLPKRYAHMLEEWAVVKAKVAQRSELTLQEVAIASLFTAEAFSWFCLGEIVGRGYTLTGYKVPEPQARPAGH